MRSDVPDFVVPLERDAELREYKPCPVCLGTNLAHIYEGVALRGNDLILDMCLACSHFFINPRPPLSAFKEFYQDDNYFELCARFSRVSLAEKMSQFDDEEFWRERGEHGRRLYTEHLQGVLTADDIAFDFGCGDGGWLWGLHQATGCQVDGEEISNVYGDIVEKRIGHPIFIGPIEETAHSIVEKYRGKVKVAIVSGSLQHMLDPRVCLVAARDILTEDGLLYVCNWSIFEHFMAEYDGGPRRLLGENLSWEHAHYFHETSFKFMLEEAGFEIVKFNLNSTVRHGHMEALLRKSNKRPAPLSASDIERVRMRIHALEAATYSNRLRHIGLDHLGSATALPLEHTEL